MIRDRILFLLERCTYNDNLILKSYYLLIILMTISIFFTSKVIKKRSLISIYSFESDLEDFKDNSNLSNLLETLSSQRRRIIYILRSI